MRLLLLLWRWFFPRRKRYIPNVLISEYTLDDATHDERLLMAWGVARSPQHAQDLLQAYGVSNAAALLRLLPRRRYRTLQQRFVDLIRRQEGHNPVDWNRLAKHAQQRIEVHYFYGADNDNHGT